MMVLYLTVHCILHLPTQKPPILREAKFEKSNLMVEERLYIASDGLAPPMGYQRGNP